MEEVYDLHQYTRLMVIYITKTKLCSQYCSTSKKNFTSSYSLTERDSCITYDKQKMNIKSLGKEHSESNDDEYDEDEDDGIEEDENEDDVCIDNFRDELYRVFKKGKEEWNEDDLFLLKAVYDFIQLSVEEKIAQSNEEIKSTDQLHYLFVVPSEWEEEIRENLLRPIFVQANLISADDHNDRLLFCSDLETVFYGLMDKKQFDFEKIRKTIFCRLCPVSEKEVLMKLDLVLTVNRLFDVPDSLLYPNVECSNQLSLTIDTFTEGIRAFIKDELPLSIQEEIIQIILGEEYEEYEEGNEDSKFYGEKEKEKEKEKEDEDEDYLKRPLITDTSIWELDKRQLDFIESICIFDICSQIRKNMTNNIDVLLSNDIIKKYNFLSCFDLFSSEIRSNSNIIKWSKYLLIYNRIYSRNENIIYSRNRETYSFEILGGACSYGKDVITNANIYCRPRILPVENSANSSSIFQEAKPDAILNIDILIESTVLDFSLLDENGYVKEVWNNDNFLKDKSLCSLGAFFSFSETTTTLNVKSLFIDFAKEYLMEDASFLSGDQNSSFLQLNAMEIETMLCKDSYTEDLLVSTQQQVYIETFLLLYMTYIKNVISSKLSDIVDSNMEINIGYNITVEKILLGHLFSTKDGLKDIIYASGLLRKDDDSKKLRIITQGERVMHLLRQSLALPFPLKSYFVLAQLHENYIQLTLNQVVTEFSSSEKNQEAIIIHDKIIHIPNIYTFLCLNMWNNIVEDSSLIKLCDVHQGYSANDLLEIFSLKNQAKFTENLKQYISKDNLGNNSSQPATDEINIQLSVSCNCRVYLTVRDIIDVSFQPVLQDIASLISASFINKELFGKFWNIQYLFQLIHFDYNSQLHDSLIKIIKETTENVLIEQGVDMPHYVITKSLNQLLQPVLHQQSISYKEFQVGTLHLVYGDRYGFRLYTKSINLPLVYKSKTKYTKTVLIDLKTVFPLFKKGEMIDDLPTNLKFYLSLPEEANINFLRINYFKLKMPCDLNSDGTVCFDDIQETVIEPDFFNLPEQLKIGQDIPILISVLYETYSGSLVLRAKLVGQDISISRSVRLGAPMHLSRF